MKKVKIPVKIRQATTNDIPAMNELFRKDLGYEECTVEIVEKQFAGLDNSREAVFLAETECTGTHYGTPDSRFRIAGVIHVEKYNVLYFPTMANILGLAVAADYRRHGIGSALLKRAEEWAHENGAYSMRLNSGESRKQAHDFYRAQGYTDNKKQLRFIKKI
ncbi:MAG: GNAT family N-acetyltransferase [Treponema sp.]|nr:GNAT family N-acetyltransferase [Treponema sp.]